MSEVKREGGREGGRERERERSARARCVSFPRHWSMHTCRFRIYTALGMHLHVGQRGRGEGKREEGGREEKRRKRRTRSQIHSRTDRQTDRQTRRRTDAEIVGKRGTGLEEMTGEADTAKHKS
jgi:hypothetical protein